LTTQHYRINFYDYLRLCLVTLSLGLTQASYGESAPIDQRPVIEMGVYAFEDAADLSAGYLALEKDLNAEMRDYRVHITLLSIKEIEQKIQSNQLDILFTNPGLFQQLRQNYSFSAPIATVQIYQNEQLLTSLGGVIFELNNTHPVNDLHQLIGKRIAIPATSNAGAYALPLYELHKAGIDKSALTFIETQNNDNVVRAVLNGDADVGFVRTGILENWIQHKQLEANRLHIIHQRNLPSFPFMVSTELTAEWPVYSLEHTDPEAIKQLTIALFHISKQHPSAQLLSINGFVPPVDCHLLEQVLRTLKLPPFNQIYIPNWYEIWRTHWPEIVLFFTLLLILILSFAWALMLRKRIQAKADQLQSVLNATKTGTWTWYLHTNQLIVDTNWANMLGYSVEALVPDISTWNQLLHPDDFPVFKTAYQQYINGESTQYDITVRLQHKAGHWLWIHTIGSFIEYDKQGVPLVMQGTHQDVTLTYTQKLQLEQAALVFDVSLEGIMITDANRNIVNVNPAFEYISGYSKAEVLGKNPRILQSGKQDKLFYQTMWQAINTHGMWRGEVWNRRKNGALYPEFLTISAIRDQHNNVVNYVAIFSDISQQKEQQARLEKLIHYDPLTELPNRLLLTERIRQAIASAIRQAHAMALLFIDLDGFKQINDTHGHDAGDFLLVEIAHRFKHALRTEDTIARLGGDEFVAVISQLQTVIELYPLINRLLDAAATPVLIHGAELHVSASIGVRFYQPTDADTALSEQTLLSQADQAMYRAKTAGKNQFCFYEENT
jgi:diguanylate cyclase (GGDEF)-like protein/PAS domain S-box-containing protein